MDSEIESTSTVTQVIDTDIQTSEILNTKNYKIALIEIFSSPLIQPVGIRNANDGSNRLFVIDQAGEILILANNSGSFVTTLCLDIKNKVVSWGEQGLLGLAFHPNFLENGYFYINYISEDPELKTVISRFSVNMTDSNLAQIDSELVILEIP